MVLVAAFSSTLLVRSGCLTELGGARLWKGPTGETACPTKQHSRNQNAACDRGGATWLQNRHAPACGLFTRGADRMLSHGGSVNSCAASGNSSWAEKKSGWCNTTWARKENTRCK